MINAFVPPRWRREGTDALVLIYGTSRRDVWKNAFMGHGNATFLLIKAYYAFKNKVTEHYFYTKSNKKMSEAKMPLYEFLCFIFYVYLTPLIRLESL